ncbi:MAG: GNAT family N-acetyltransferase [Ruminococcaceae bacterium]|nr:GNAT family N-acetyltransferase [Oscillospiraceae bacterium]
MIIDTPNNEQISELRELWKENFGDTDEFLDLFFGMAFSKDRCRCVSIDGKTVASLYWFDCEYDGKRVAYLYAISTSVSQRGKGICSELMRDTHAYLESQGYAMSILVPATNPLFSFYERLGYVTCTSVSETLVCASYDKIELERIGSKEYGALRKQMLPDGSVIQEAENLAFLNILADLYKCDGAIFALQKGNDTETLRVVELLGDKSIAPSIIGTLGYEKAIVRTQGEEKEFSMCFSLCEKDIALPKYFGLAFD